MSSCETTRRFSNYSNIDEDTCKNNDVVLNTHEISDEEVAHHIIQDLSRSADIKFDCKVPVPGETVECVTESKNFNGVVLVYDDVANFIILQDIHSNTSKRQINIINLSHVICIRKRSGAPPTNFVFTPPKISQEIIKRRLDAAKRQKDATWRMLEASNASYDAINAYFELERLFGDVRWDGDKIIAFRCLAIREPFDEYSVEALDGRASSTEAIASVKKILSKLHTIKTKRGSYQHDSTNSSPSGSTIAESVTAVRISGVERRRSTAKEKS